MNRGSDERLRRRGIVSQINQKRLQLSHVSQHLHCMPTTSCSIEYSVVSSLIHYDSTTSNHPSTFPPKEKLSPRKASQRYKPASALLASGLLRHIYLQPELVLYRGQYPKDEKTSMNTNLQNPSPQRVQVRTTPPSSCGARTPAPAPARFSSAA